MTPMALTIRDILTYELVAKNMDNILPFVIVPVLLGIATISRAVTVVTMVGIGVATLYVVSRPRQKNRSPFFYSWTLSSGTYMFLVFELFIIKLLMITQLEHFVFLVLLSCTFYFFYKMKDIADFELAIGSSKGKEYSPVLTSDSLYCQICQIEVNDRFFHSIWWNCCVLRPNYPYFLAGQIFAFATLLYASYLGLTSVCFPYAFGMILLPGNCENVYYEFHVAIGFVYCVYAVGYLCVITVVLIHQVISYIPKYSEPRWRKLMNVLNV